MRFLGVIGILFVWTGASAETSGGKLWQGLKEKRESLTSFHQEFDVSQTSRSGSASRASKRQVILDVSAGKWREKSISGSGNFIRIFDGKDLFRIEEGGDEYVRMKLKTKDEDAAPSPYSFTDADWLKAQEAARQPCGIAGAAEHQCVAIDTPLKPSIRSTSGPHLTRVLEGKLRVVMDTETGLLLSFRSVRLMDNGKTQYQVDVTYVAKRLTAGVPANASLFEAPTGEMREVKEFAKWNAAQIKKQLTGKPAPELAALDMDGNPVDLSAFKGKTVLLDFWATWCPPCRADGPALDKLYGKYAGKELMIVGVDVSEARDVVEKFLRAHPHKYPVVLSSENILQRSYQVNILPTYIVIDKDGAVAAAVEGDQGFGELRKLLKKSGLETE